MLSGTDAWKMVRFVAIGGDEPRQRLNGRKGKLLFAATTAILVIAASSYWIGVQSARQGTTDAAPVPSIEQPGATAVAARMQPTSSEMPSIKSPDRHPRAAGSDAVQKKVRPAIGSRKSRIALATRHAGSSHPMPSRNPRDTRTDSKRTALGATPATYEMVRIGRFDSNEQAQREWTDVLRRWPDMRRLSVVPVQIKSLRDGKTYYRLQLGTSSRAHSEVVCKRAHDLDQSCSIIAAEEDSRESPL